MASKVKLRVLATGVYESALHELAALCAKASGQELESTIANAGGVIARLEAGEAFDVVMTSAAGIETLAAAGRILPQTRVDVGRMRLGAAVKRGAPVPDMATPDMLRDALLAASAVAVIDPQGGGTSGPFLQQIFERLGIAGEVRAKTVLCKTGREVVGAIASGRVSLGFTQASELIGPPGVQFAGFLPENLQFVTPYSAALGAAAKAPDAAKAFLDLLTGGGGKNLLRSSGWEIAE